MQCGEIQLYQAMWYQSIAGNINFQKALKKSCGWYDNINLYLNNLFISLHIVLHIGYIHNHKFLFSYLTRFHDLLLMYINVNKIFTHPTRPSSPRQQNREIHNPSYSPEKK